MAARPRAATVAPEAVSHEQALTALRPPRGRCDDQGGWTMATITVSVQGKKVFEWDGDATAFGNIEDHLRGVSAAGGTTLPVAAENVVRRFRELRLRKQ